MERAGETVKELLPIGNHGHSERKKPRWTYHIRIAHSGGMTDQEPSDQALVADALARPHAYGALVERYTPRLLRYARRLGCRSEQDAKDVLQETFIKAYLNLRSYDSDLAFSSWMYRICHNETISWFRKQRIRPQPAASDDEVYALETLPDTRDLLGGIEQGLHRDHLERALAELSPDYREVIVLKYFEEQSYEEMADILQKPPGTIATLLNRAKKQLRERLAHYPL